MIRQEISRGDSGNIWKDGLAMPITENVEETEAEQKDHMDTEKEEKLEEITIIPSTYNEPIPTVEGACEERSNYVPTQLFSHGQ